MKDPKTKVTRPEWTEWQRIRGEHRLTHRVGHALGLTAHRTLRPLLIAVHSAGSAFARGLRFGWHGFDGGPQSLRLQELGLRRNAPVTKKAS